MLLQDKEMKRMPIHKLKKKEKIENLKMIQLKLSKANKIQHTDNRSLEEENQIRETGLILKT